VGAGGFVGSPCWFGSYSQDLWVQVWISKSKSTLKSKTIHVIQQNSPPKYMFFNFKRDLQKYIIKIRSKMYLYDLDLFINSLT
jgi:hypothetical protein